MKSSKRKKRWWLLILPLLLIIGAVGFWLAKERFDLSVPGTGSKQEALPTAEVVTGSIEVITEGSGSVEAATVNNISLKYGGKFSSILVEEGDQVSEGQILAEYDPDSLDAIVLGCTHYVFLKSLIRSMLPQHVFVVDGNEGTARQLKHILEEKRLCSSGGRGTVKLYTSGDAHDIEVMKQLYAYDI